MFAKKTLFAVVAIALLAAAVPAQAANNYFLGTFGSDYSDGSDNWFLGNVPAGTDVGIISNGLTATLSSDVSAFVPTQLNIGDGTDAGYIGSGELDLSDGAVLKAGATLRIGEGAAGIFRMTTAGGAAPTLTTTSNLYVGDTGVGTLNMNGGTINDGGYFMVGYQAGGSGSTATISGGVIHATGGGLYAGWNGAGTITVTGGKITATNNLFVGGVASGKFYQSGGAITTWGLGGSGDLQLGGGAGDATIGDMATVTGTAMLTVNKLSLGYNSVAPATMNVGDAPGTLPADATANNPTLYINSNIYLGYNNPHTSAANGAATLNLTGGTINITAVSSIVHVGVFGQGTYNQTGGTLNCNTGGFDIGNYYAASGYANTGAATISGGVINTPFLKDGAAATANSCTFTQTGGTVNVYGTPGITGLSTISRVYALSGGLLDMTGCVAGTTSITDPNGVVQTLPVRGTPNGAGGTISGVNFQFSGGTLTNAASVTTGVALSGAAAVINSAAVNGTISGVMSGTGGFTKVGVGKLTLTAADTYTGDTLVQQGALSVTGSLQSAVTVASGATLGGSGSVKSVTGLAGSFLRPDDPSTLSIIGDLSFAGTLEFLYDGAAAQPVSKVAVGGNVNVTGATFDFTQIGSALTASSYTLLTYGGALTGTPTGTNVPAGYGFQYAPGSISLVQVPEPSTLTLLVLGFIGVATFVWRRR